ncbi:hypothetical protein [Shewanella sp. 10N.286.48.A6]|uniref:hypothetical protein n=1 Tax=Shewanella sp. 10N.286.48.A6 TaxID=1880833 RepID=UPI000C816163|nr:hypothetical protein [Shewanella sp. 10N.286.48.A6]PMI02823.1 hypothetical protein BCU55_04380 [Shewanella sp. 10N.286.48.A6]
MENSGVELINRIIRFNHAWKLAQKQYGDSSPITLSLRDQKACLQAQLLREHSGVYLVLDKDSETEEPLYSVQLETAIPIDSLGYRTDAEHLPVRIAEKLLSKKELSVLIRE